MGMILCIASRHIVGSGDIVGRSGCFKFKLSANSVMRGRVNAIRTFKGLVADLRTMRKTFLRLCKSSLLCNVALIAFLLFPATTVLEAGSLVAKTITGTVTSATDHEPLIGVTVKVLGANTGSVTDFDGKYSINVESGQSLQFSYVGFLSKTVKAGGENVINAVLSEDNKSLEEVVVVG